MTAKKVVAALTFVASVIMTATFAGTTSDLALCQQGWRLVEDSFTNLGMEKNMTITQEMNHKQQEQYLSKIKLHTKKE